MAERLSAFVQDLTDVLNRYSMENGSNTPDFILAEYLLKCLETWNATVMHRERWYGRVPLPVPASTTPTTPTTPTAEEVTP